MKSEVIRELHALLHERLFGGGPWLAQCETPRRLSKVRRTWAGGAGFGRVGSFARDCPRQGTEQRRHRIFRVFATDSRDLCPRNPIIFSLLPNELPETFCGSQTRRAIVVLQCDARIGVM
jgi:hypothetical protein